MSELVALAWGDVIERDDKVQLHIIGKGRKVRQVLLPEVVSRSLLALRRGAAKDAPVFASWSSGPLTQRAVNYMLKRAAAHAGLPPQFSAHWLRH